MLDENRDTEYINLSEIEGISHEELFHDVAAAVAADTLQYVNEHDKKVVPRDTVYTRYVKRLLDLLISAAALLITSPVNLVLAVCTFFDVGRPIIFRQQRVGRDHKPFTIVKFRNMTNAVNDSGELLPPDQRVTKFGKFVRKTSLDELLNFWSIFKGDMSLIGPRPLAMEYEERYSVRHKMRYAIKPGLECPHILKEHGGNTWVDQFENDVYYVEHVSLLLDIKMVLALVKMVFNRKSSDMRGKAARGSFIGYNKDGSSINAHRVPAHYVNQVLEGYQAEIKD